MPSSADLSLFCVAPDRAAAMWPHVEPFFAAATRRVPLAALEDLKRDILNGNALIWIVWDGSHILAALVTALQRTDAGLICLLQACGGTEMGRWLPLLPRIEQFAKNQGCVTIRMTGRRGWSRALAGFRSRHVILDKDLT